METEYFYLTQNNSVNDQYHNQKIISDLYISKGAEEQVEAKNKFSN